jgi:ligand-binding SRPBCC domain-containing protein
LARLCVAWEAEAQRAVDVADRVAIVRIGVVLGDGGGAMAKMLPLFRLGLGGRLGRGNQWVSWIHLNDIVEVFAQAATDDRYSGVLNGTSPQPVTNRELTRALGRVLHRPTFAAAPVVALKLTLGSAASAVLASQRVNPRRLRDLGFEFTFPVIDEALAQMVYDAPTVIIARIVAVRPDNAYVRRHHPTHVLYDRTLIDAPIRDVFAFFARGANVGAVTPPDMGLSIRTSGELMIDRGVSIDYGVVAAGIPLALRSFVDTFRPEEHFADAQVKGPFRCWYHEHVFRADGERTMMEDRVWYALPLGPLGRIVHTLKVRRMLQRMFEYRTSRIALRFGRVRSESRQPAKHVRAIATTESASADVS